MGYNFPNSPTEGQEYTPANGITYVYRAPRWLAASSGSVGGGGETESGIPEAPIDGQQYAREDAAWSVVQAASGGSGGNVDAGLSGSWYQNRRWYALGTSITIGNAYTGAIATLSGMILTNRGVGGASLSTASNGNIWTQLTTNVPADAEVITIETINDFRLDVPLGAVTDPENPATSYFGALRAACNWCLTNRPAARVFLFTAYGDAYVGGYPNGETPNAAGKHYWEFNDAMIKVGRIYGIPVIDVGGESGINFHTCQFYTDDMIHPNALGGQRYADYVWSKIRMQGWLASRPTAPGAQVPVAVTGVTINQGAAVSLAPANTLQLTITIAPSNATNKGVSWGTSDASKVTVSSDGLITAVANGAANITVTTADGGFTDVLAVTVATAAATSVDVTPATALLLPTETQQLTATVLPSNAGNKNVTWASNNTGLATVNGSGLVTAVAVGTPTITATTVDGGFTDTCAVTVTNSIPVSSVDLTPASATVPLGGTTQLTATVLPANATNKSVSYQSSDTGKATVSSTGLVTGVAVGTADITVTTADGGKTDVTAATVAAAEWVLSLQTTFRDSGLDGVTASGSNPTYTTTTGGATYGALIISSPGHNAIEFTLPNTAGKNLWIVYGTAVTDAYFAGCGDFSGPTVTHNGRFDAGNINLKPGLTPTSAAPGFATGVVYRVGRVGTRVKVVRVDAGSTLVTILDIDIAAAGNIGAADANWYVNLDLGVLGNATPGGTYILPLNCKTGTWTP